MIKIAQLKQLNNKSLNRFQKVLEVLLATQKEAERMIAEIQRVITEHDIKGEVLKKEAAEQRAIEVQNRRARVANNKGKGKQRDDSPVSEDEFDDEDEDEDDLPKTPAGKEHRDKRRALKQRLREARIQYHRVKFLQGDVYHNLGVKESEDAAYQEAEDARRNILKSTLASYPCTICIILMMYHQLLNKKSKPGWRN